MAVHGTAARRGWKIAPAILLIIACRSEAPTGPVEVEDEHQRAHAATARLVAFCKAGDESACERIGLARPVDDGAQAPTDDDITEDFATDDAEAIAYEAAASEDRSDVPSPRTDAEWASATATATMSPQPEAPRVTADETQRGWYCYEATLRGSPTGACFRSSDVCKRSRADTRKRGFRVKKRGCFELPRAACFFATQPLRAISGPLCFPSFEACYVMHEYFATSVEWDDVTQCEAYD